MMERMEEYQKTLENEELADSTIRLYIREARRLLEWAGHDLKGKQQVIRYKKELERHCSTSTVNLKVTAVNRYLSFFGRPDWRVRQKKQQKGRNLETVITETEYRALEEYLLRTGQQKYYAVLKTLALTGIRVSELQYITVEHVRKGYASIENKGKIREIYISDSLRRIVLEYCREAGIAGGAVFRGNKGLPISRVAVWKKFNQMAEKTGIPKEKLHPHSFRHYFALRYMDQYGNLFELADILGHSSLETTRIYLSSSIEDKRRRLDGLAGL